LLEQNKAQEKHLKESVGKYEKNIQLQEHRAEQDAERLRQKELRLTAQLEEKFKRFVKEWKDAKNKKTVLDKYNSQLNDRKNVLNQKDQVKQEELIKYNSKMIKTGSTVRLKNGRVEGKVQSIEGQKVTIVFGNVKTVAELVNLHYVEEQKAEKKPAPKVQPTKKS
jgi:hypothetical protein